MTADRRFLLKEKEEKKRTKPDNKKTKNTNRFNRAGKQK